MHSKWYIDKYWFGLALLLGLFTGPALQAQTEIRDALVNWGYYSAKQLKTGGTYTIPADGEWYQADSWGPSYYNLLLPQDISYSYLYVEAVGGDGKEKDKNGGKGAKVLGYFPIGTQAGEIPPEATLRFLIGQNGQSSGGGGGGTGLAVKDPDTDEWTLLVVAGGGGGGAG